MGSRRAVANGRRRPWQPRALAGIGESATRQALAHAAANPHPNLAVTIDFARWERLGRGMGEKIKGPAKVTSLPAPSPREAFAQRESKPSGPLAPRSGERVGARGSGVLESEGDAQGASCEGLWLARKWARPLRG